MNLPEDYFGALSLYVTNTGQQQQLPVEVLEDGKASSSVVLESDVVQLHRPHRDGEWELKLSLWNTTRDVVVDTRIHQDNNTNSNTTLLMECDKAEDTLWSFRYLSSNYSHSVKKAINVYPPAPRIITIKLQVT